MNIHPYFKGLAALAVIGFLSACGAKSDSGDPVAKLASLKEQRAALETQISALEKDLIAQGLLEKKLRTIAYTPVANGVFRHYIDLQGKVDAEESVPVTAKMPGVLTNVYVKNGDYVKKGQLMAQTDDAVMSKTIDELEGQLAVATDIYNRQKSLWDQHIGSEVQYIQAKNGKESIERSIATLKENQAMSRILAPISGSVDMVLLKAGQAIAPGAPLCYVINLDKLKIVGDVTEAYVTKVKKGDAVQLYFPDSDKTVSSRVTYVSKAINPMNRTFMVECELGRGDYKANQITVLKIVDYENKNAISIPVNMIQSDENGDYVLIMNSTDNPNEGAVAKSPITMGQTYNGYVEITSGLKPEDKLITTGFQDVHAGEIVRY